MVEQSKISSLMYKDHLRLLSLLHKIEQKSFKDLQEKYDFFMNFKWNIEKHFFTEEKTVFTSFKTRKGTEPYRLFYEISKQHTKILNEINKNRELLTKNIDLETLNLRDLLIKHQSFEEKIVYPRLDKELDEDHKMLIVDRMTEIIYF